MTTDNKWYAVRTVTEHINEEKWRIVDQSADNVLNPIDVGQQEAERNAKLCAAAPEMLQMLEDIHSILQNTWGIGHPEVDGWVIKYKQLLKQTK